MAGTEALPEDPRRIRRAPPLRAARRTALCQWRHPHRPRGEQDPQGRDRPFQDPGRLRRALRAGLGLPRPADRAPDRKGPRQAPARRQGARTVPQLRGRAGGAAEEGLHPPRRARRLGQSLPDHGLSQRGRRDPRGRRPVPDRLPVRGLEAGELVLRLRLGTGRGRSRVPGQEVAGDRCRLSPRRCGARARRPCLRHQGAARRRLLDGDLDHHAMDHPVEPGTEHASGIRLRAGEDGARLHHPCRRVARGGTAALRPRRRGARRLPGRGALIGEVPPSFLRPCVARLSGRLRHARRRYRHRPQRAGLWPGGFRILPQARHAQRRDPHPGAGRRRVCLQLALLRRHVCLEGQSGHHREAGRGRQPVWKRGDRA